MNCVLMNLCQVDIVNFHNVLPNRCFFGIIIFSVSRDGNVDNSDEKRLLLLNHKESIYDEHY